MPKRGEQMDDTSLAIGGLQADVRNLSQSIEALNRVWGERETAATDGRRALHEKLDAVCRQVYELEAGVENVSKDITEIKPAVEEFRNQRQRAIGAKRLGVKLWAALVAGAAVLGWFVHEIVTWFRH